MKVFFFSRLPYTDATIIEVQRAANMVPGGVQHSTTKYTTLGGSNEKDTQCHFKPDLT